MKRSSVSRGRREQLQEEAEAHFAMSGNTEPPEPDQYADIDFDPFELRDSPTLSKDEEELPL